MLGCVRRRQERATKKLANKYVHMLLANPQEALRMENAMFRRAGTELTAPSQR